MTHICAHTHTHTQHLWCELQHVTGAKIWHNTWNYLRNKVRETLWIRGQAISLAHGLLWNPGDSWPESQGSDATRPLRPHQPVAPVSGIRWIYNISSTSSAPCSPALQGPWWVRGQCILTTRRQSTFTLMAPGQSAPWSCWDAGSHGNLWTRQQNRGEGRQHDLISHGFLVYLYIHIYVATNKYSFFMLPWFSARYFMNLSAKYMSLI